MSIFLYLSRCRPVCEALAIGLILGFADSRYAGDMDYTSPAYLACGAVLGFRYAGRACPCWPVLGVSLYAAHVVAIASGRKPPFVEENYRFAEQCLWVAIPSGLGLMAGVTGRVALTSLGWLRRKSGPPVRILPRSTREVMVVVACSCIGLSYIHRAISPPTVFASGFDEARFSRIRPGMTRDQVASALGPPLKTRIAPPSELWEYSDQWTHTSNYERRWVIFEDGRVRDVVTDYWID
jgi:SmpA / OmlA family